MRLPVLSEFISFEKYNCYVKFQDLIKCMCCDRVYKSRILWNRHIDRECHLMNLWHYNRKLSLKHREDYKLETEVYIDYLRVCSIEINKKCCNDVLGIIVQYMELPKTLKEYHIEEVQKDLKIESRIKRLYIKKGSPY